jgi:hypothetical protein
LAQNIVFSHFLNHLAVDAIPAYGSLHIGDELGARRGYQFNVSALRRCAVWEGSLKCPIDRQPSVEARKAAEAEAQRICVNLGGILNLEVLGALANLHKGSPAAVCIADRIALLRKQDVPAPGNSTNCRFVEALVGNQQRCLKPKDVFRDCPDCPEMVVVPANSFTLLYDDADQERAR